MITTKVDNIVRQVLLENGLSAHFYIRLLSLGLDCLKELELDRIGRVRTVVLTADEFSRVPIPCNYVDWIRVGEESGQYVHNMAVTRNFNRKLKEEDGVLVPFESASGTAGMAALYTFFEDYTNNQGEYVGKQFGGMGTPQNQFMVIEESDEIQLSLGYKDKQVTIDYLAYDPTDATAPVPKYAEATIKSYIEYRFELTKPRSSNYQKEYLRRHYVHAKKVLAARTSDVTTEGVRALFENRHRLTQ